MKKPILLLILSYMFLLHAHAQFSPYGTVDTADLKMTSCDFEKDANAEVLFDHASVNYKYDDIIYMERHKRIKIFNDKGKDEANIRIEFYGAHGDEVIADVEAETINLTNGSIELTPVDKKLIYTEVTDKNKRAIVFTFPNVRAGSVVEFKYTLKTPYVYNYPDWYFQTSIPTRYSEFDAGFTHQFVFHYFKKVYQAMAKDTTVKDQKSSAAQHIWALANIRSYKMEPYMDYPEDYLQCITFKPFNWTQTWGSVGDMMLNDVDFGVQLNKSLTNEQEIISKANALKTDDAKIAYLFDTVKYIVKWNKVDHWFTIDGVKKAWDKKSGNSTEINLVLYHLLRAAKIKSSLMAVCTRDNGRLDPDYATASNLSKTVVYLPVDSSKHYIMDASSQYNTYNTIPMDLVGLTGLSIDPSNKKAELITIKNGVTREVILTDGIISPDGKLQGNTQISSSTYSREKYLKRYNDAGEKKYIDEIQEINKGLNITSLNLKNIENDTLPLIQTFEFKYNLTEPDGDYLYFNPNLFTGFEVNPFLAETRISNIDFGCLNSYSINGRYKIPDGYKVDALPKPTGMQMGDKSISFKRFVAVDDGVIIIRFAIDFKRAVFLSEEYPSIRDFYKKMFEMLNEPIVLKKS